MGFSPDRRVRVRDLFPDGDARDASLLRLLVICRQAHVLGRSVHKLSGTQAPDGQETLHHLLVLFAGSLREAADAFNDCDSQDLFGFLAWEGAPFADFRRSFAHVRALVDKKDPTSLYSRLLTPVRNQAAFHINRNAVQEAIAGLGDDTFPLAAVDESDKLIALPIATAVATYIAWEKNGAFDNVKVLISDLYSLDEALVAVSHDLYVLTVRLRLKE